MDDLMIIVGVIAAAVVVFGLLREFFTWYWKINMLVKGQAETNRLLKQILSLQRTGDIYEGIEGEVLVENTSTGEIKGISKAEWEKLIASNKNQKKYRLIKDKMV